MIIDTLIQLRKRRLVQIMALWPWVAGCTAQAGASNDPQWRFRGVGLVLVVDAVPGIEIEGLQMFDDRGLNIYSSSLTSKRVRKILAIGSGRVPLTVKAIWRDHPKPVWGLHGGIDYEGPIVGDYTIDVAERVPQAVLDNIRNKGGDLRLKYRLKADGVLFGWDIERDGAGTGFTFKFDMPGGDFLETRY